MGDIILAGIDKIRISMAKTNVLLHFFRNSTRITEKYYFWTEAFIISYKEKIDQRYLIELKNARGDFDRILGLVRGLYFTFNNELTLCNATDNAKEIKNDKFECPEYLLAMVFDDDDNKKYALINLIKKYYENESKVSEDDDKKYLVVAIANILGGRINYAAKLSEAAVDFKKNKKKV